jgi:sigma-B regulation protein RsbU (phosphoserine phosphatase)
MTSSVISECQPVSVELELIPDSTQLYEHAACGLLLTDANGEIKRVNQTFCIWLGMEREALLGRRFQDLLNMGGKIFHQTHWAPLLQVRGSVSEVKLELVHRDGRGVTMMLNAIRRETAQGCFHELAVFIAEERNRYERELVAARAMAEDLLLQQLAVQKELTSVQNRLRLANVEAEIHATFTEQLVAIVSHDLRNPLAAIKMAAGLIGSGELSPRQGRVLGHIDQSVDRAQRLIVDLMDFTQVRIGRGISVSPQPIELHKVIARCLDELRVAFPGRSLVHQCIGQGPCTADPDRLFRLTENLVSNAMTYGAADREVVVTTAFDDRGIKLSVHNVGQPIAPERLDELFEPISLGVADDDERHSVGLGLFIVREIVRAHWGEVTVISTEQDGTTFTVSLARPLG